MRCSNIQQELTPRLPFVPRAEKTEISICTWRCSLHFHPYWVKYKVFPHGWPALARRHRIADPRSGLHGDEQDLGRYPAYWKRGLLLTFRNGEGAAALLEHGWGVEMDFGVPLPGTGGGFPLWPTHQTHLTGQV